MSPRTTRVVVDLADMSAMADIADFEPDEIDFELWAENPHRAIEEMYCGGWKLVSVSHSRAAIVYWFQHEVLEPYAMTKRLRAWSERTAYQPDTDEDLRLKLLAVASATADLVKLL